MLNSSDFSDIFDMIRQESDAKMSEGGAKSDKKSKKSKKRKISNSSRTNTNYNNNSTRSSKKSRMEVLVNLLMLLINNYRSSDYRTTNTKFYSNISSRFTSLKNTFYGTRFKGRC